MKTFLRSFHFALGVSAGIAMLAGCGESHTISALPAQVANRSSAHPLSSGYKSLYSFKTKPDGNGPAAPLVEVNGKLYGTTADGGASGHGTVFEISTSGEETVLYSFRGHNDGATPVAGLTVVDGKLYGTTNRGGGLKGYGTVFEISTSGTETVIHRFNGKDGEYPAAGLIYVKGTLYGTTFEGGDSSNCCGTVFSMSLSGDERVLYHFKGKGIYDEYGYAPEGSVIYVNGKLYGTASGGAKEYGVVFEVSMSGQERVLYSFKGFPKDGTYPYAGLVALGGKLYGTTYEGGRTGECDYSGCGTVFEVSPASGEERVVYVFRKQSSGDDPLAGLIVVGGVLYGVATEGGYLKDYCAPHGCGTIFKLTTSGNETTLYTFRGSGDGAEPEADLLVSGGTLYGTTYIGGANSFGTVFQISP
jgi:uncharacterized repeat protein (TIGR03803 family)